MLGLDENFVKEAYLSALAQWTGTFILAVPNWNPESTAYYSGFLKNCSTLAFPEASLMYKNPVRDLQAAIAAACKSFNISEQARYPFPFPYFVKKTPKI